MKLLINAGGKIIERKRITIKIDGKFAESIWSNDIWTSDCNIITRFAK